MSPRRYSKFQEGVMTAAHHIETCHGDTGLRDEVLALACLKLDDLRRVYADALRGVPPTEGHPK